MKSPLQVKQKAVCIIIALFSLGLKLSAQQYFKEADYFHKPLKLGVGVEQYVSGNWHGTHYSPYLMLSKGKSSFAFGPVVQKRTLETTGGRVIFSRVITGGNPYEVDCDGERVDGLFQMNYFIAAQYLCNTRLAYSSVRIEERSNKGSDISWKDLRLCTAEISAGIEVYVKISRNLNWKNYFGASVYNHVKYQQGMYHEKIAPVLMIGTGLILKQK
jgi:hypothetical protein